MKRRSERPQGHLKPALGADGKVVEGLWRFRFVTGYDEKGQPKLKQVTIRKKSKKEARDAANEILKSRRDGTWVEPTELTLGAWLERWLEKNVKARQRASTHRRYQTLAKNLGKFPVASIKLQRLVASDLEHWYDTCGLNKATLPLYHSMLRKALKVAVRDKECRENVALLVEHPPRRVRYRDGVELVCWTADEAKQFLAVATKADPQNAALFRLALDTGARKSELLGLCWSDIDMNAGTVRIHRQLVKTGAEPEWGGTKTGAARTLTLTTETVDLLRKHKQRQAEVKMLLRREYKDFGLVFAKEDPDFCGQPLQANNIQERAFAKLIKEAGVRRITFHGLRHTVATLLLMAGEPVHVVAERLGHRDPTVTMTVYSHVLPNQQRQAADKLAALLR